MNVAATITLTPGTVISRLTSGQASASAAISASTAAISVSRKSTWRRQPSTVSRSASAAPAPASQRLPLTPNRSDAGGRPLRQRIEHRVHLVLGARARPHELPAAREPAPHRADALVGHPDPVELPCPEQLRQRARVEAVGLRPRLADAGVADGETTITRATCGSMMRAISQALPVTSSATWSCTSRLCANSSSASGSVSIRPAERSSPSFDDRHLAEIAVDVQRHCSQPRPPLVGDWKLENRWANDIDGSVLAAQPGKSQGRPLKSSGSKPIVQQTACPACVLPKGPSSQSTRT